MTSVRSLQKIEEVLRLPSPLQAIERPCWNFTCWMKRDDLIHPLISGNKWRKLKHGIIQSLQNGQNKWVTFGGPYSNHLCAVSTVASLFGVSLTVYVRGEPHYIANPTLTLIKQQGTEIVFVPRHQFRDKMQKYPMTDPDVFVIPEGGSDALVLTGIQEMMDEIYEDLEQVDQIWVACGSGGTLAGIISAKRVPSIVRGVSVVKDDSLHRKIETIADVNRACKWDLITPSWSGGFGSWTNSYIDFLRGFYEQTSILLDPIYTGRLLHQLDQDAAMGLIPADSQVVVIHSGGLQGIAAFEYQNNLKLYPE